MENQAQETQQANAPFTLEDWINTRPAIYDREAEFEEHIAPLMEQVAKELQARGFAFHMVAAYKSEENGTTCRSLMNLVSVEAAPLEVLMSFEAGQLSIPNVFELLSAHQARREKWAQPKPQAQAAAE